MRANRHGVWVLLLGLTLWGCDEAGESGSSAADASVDSGGAAGEGGTGAEDAGGEPTAEAGADAASDAQVDAGDVNDASEEASTDSDASGGTGAFPTDGWGAVFDADGAAVSAVYEASSTAVEVYAIAITGLGDERYLELGGDGVVGPGARLRMLPIDQTGTYTCGEGPNSYRLVEMIVYVDGVTYTANADQGSCTIEVTKTGDVYEGTFQGSLPPSGDPSGTAVQVTSGAFRNDGSML